MPSIHEEVYRPFEGTLRRRPLRFWPMVAANVRVATRKKLPLVLIYAVPTIAGIVFAWMVYLRYAAEAASLPEAASGGSRMIDLLARRALKQLEVRNQIAAFVREMQRFALIPAAWYGAGLIAEDVRLGAHQLYFSRPLTRLDYFLGKFLTVAFFTAGAVWLPPMLICLVAGFASEDWAFFRQEGDVVLAATLYSLTWVVVTSSAVLCASALAPRRLFALVGVFAFFMLLQAMSMILGHALEADVLFALSPLNDLERIANGMFDQERAFPPISTGLAWGATAGFTVLSLGVVAWRLRRLEAVA